MKTLQESILGGGLENDLKHKVEDIELFKHGVQLERVDTYNWTRFNWKDYIDLDYIEKNLNSRGITNNLAKLEKQYKLKRSKTKTVGSPVIEEDFYSLICYLMSIPLPTVVDYYGNETTSDIMGKWLNSIIKRDDGEFDLNMYQFGFYYRILLTLKSTRENRTPLASDNNDILHIVMQVPKKEFNKYL